MFNTLRVCFNRFNVVHSYRKIMRKMITFTAYQHMYYNMNEITSIRSSGSLIVFSSSTCIPSSFNCQNVSTDEKLPKMSKNACVYLYRGETSKFQQRKNKGCNYHITTSNTPNTKLWLFVTLYFFSCSHRCRVNKITYIKTRWI